MTINAAHIIEKFNVEFNTSLEENGKQLKGQTTDLFKQKLLPKLEKLFDQFGANQNIRIDQLSIEVNTQNPIQFEDQFIQQILTGLSKKLEQASENMPDSKNRTIEVFEHFLENGNFPWWTSEYSMDQLESELLNENKFIDRLPKILEGESEKLNRLVFQFSDDFLEFIVHQNYASSTDLIIYFQTLQKSLSASFEKSIIRNEVWIGIMQSILLKKRSIEQSQLFVFETLVKRFAAFEKRENQKLLSKDQLSKLLLKDLEKVANEDLLTKLKAISAGINSESNSVYQKKPFASKEVKVSKTENQSDQNSWYIKNAGLILLHPFFVLFFEELGLTKEKEFIDFHSKNQAALLLHYLVSNQTQSSENELVLNKLLCDIPLNMPLKKDLIIDEKIKEESNNLMNAAIKHWSALKNTTPDGLRNTFLKREGKLSRTEDGSWKLFIQYQTFDILISKLPWNLSIIKLPWMKNMLQVEWA